MEWTILCTWTHKATNNSAMLRLDDDGIIRQQTSAVRCSHCRTATEHRCASSPPSAMRGRGRRGLLALARPALVALSGLATAATADAALIDPRGVGRDEHRRGGGLRRTRRRAETPTPGGGAANWSYSTSGPRRRRARANATRPRSTRSGSRSTPTRTRGRRATAAGPSRARPAAPESTAGRCPRAPSDAAPSSRGGCAPTRSN